MNVLRRAVSVVLVFTLVFFYSGPFATVFAEGNAAPAIEGLTDATIAEDETTTLYFTVSDDTTPAGELSINAVSDNHDLLGSLSPHNDNGNVSLPVAPNEHANGTANITVTVTDAEGASETQTILLAVTPVNYAPEARDVNIISIEASPQQPVEITLDADDPDGDSLTYAITDQSGIEGKGTLSEISGSNVTFYPDPYWNGAAFFKYKAGDGEFDSNEATVTVTVSSVNFAPVSDDQSVSCLENGSVEITLGASDPDGDTLTYAVVDGSGLEGKGTLSEVSGNSVTFTPLGDWSGTASFTFKANDGELDSNVSTVTITADPVNDAPVSYDGSVSADEDVPVEITLQASDAEGDTLMFGIVDDSGLAGKGTLSAVSGNKVTFTPEGHWNGAASFTFKANDGELDSNVSTVTITVDPVNDAPVSYDGFVPTDEHVPVEITLQASDPDGDTLTYVIIDDSGLAGKGTLSAVSGNKVTFTPEGHWNGTASFTFKANDGKLDSNVSTVTITVDPVNDAPVSYGGSVSTDEDVPVEITLPADDVEGDTLAYIIADDSGLAGKGTLSAVSGNKVTFTPSGNWNGTASFTFKANDGQLDSNVSTVTITVNPVNDAPVSYDGIASTDEHVPVEITLQASDAEGSGLTFGIVDDSGLAGKGALSEISGNKVTFTPSGHWNGAASFTFRANDGELDSNVSTVTITADPVNDAPVSYDGAASTDEHVPIEITLPADDVEGDGLNFTIVDALGLFGKGTLSLDGNIATFTPIGHWNGTASFTFRANDGEFDSNISTITITVNNINDAPEAQGDTAATDEHVPVTIDVLLNDADVDLTTNPGEEQLGISVSSSPLHGSAGVVDGKIVYTPAGHWNGIDTFEYTATDLGGLSSTASVTVAVAPVFDAPAAAGDEAVTDEHVPATIYVLDNDGDVDLFDVPPTDELSIDGVTQPAHGAAAVSEDKKTVLYTPSGHWNGADTFTYVVIDKGGLTSTASVTVTVNPVNDAPAALSDTASVNEDLSVLINVLANDTDVDFQDVPATEHHTVISVGAPENGAAAIEDNKVRYTPTLHWFGTDTFTYTMEDSGGITSSASVTVTVVSINDTPVISDVSGGFTINEHGTAIITFDISDVETPTESLLLQYSSSDQTLLPDANITLTGTGSEDPERTLTLRPAGHNYGSADITLKLSDGFLVTTHVITLTVNPVNDQPTANTDTLNFTEDVPLTIDMDNLVSNDTDVKGDDLWFLSYENDVSKGAMTLIDGPEHIYLYTPPQYFDGTATFHYIVTDGELTARGTVNLRAIPVNNVPAITMDEDYPSSTDEDATLDGLGFTIFDPETGADELALTAVCGDKELIEDGGITITRGEDGHCALSVRPNAHKNGTADITISVSDGENTASETFAFTVNPVEYPAMAVDDAYTTEKDSSLTVAPLQNDYDWDNDALSLVTINGSGDTTIVTAKATITRNADNTVTYMPAPGVWGEDTFTYGIVDECGLGCLPSVATVTITVSGGNAAPELSPLADRIIMENESGENSFVFYDSDIADSWTFSAVSSNQALLPDGNIIIDPELKKLFFTPSEYANGETNITFTVTDSGGLSGSYTFKLTVLAVNYPPALQTVDVNVDENGYIDIDLLEGAADPDGDGLRVVSVVGYVNGIVTPLGDGVYRYMPFAYFSGEDSLTYTVTDGNCTVTKAGSITINEVNYAPVAMDDWCVSDGTIAITVDVLANDYDLDNRYDADRDTLLVDAITVSPLHGTAAVSADNKTVVYTPDLSDPGSGDDLYDTFTYSITDSHGASGTAVVHVSRIDGGGSYTPVVYGITDEFFEDSGAHEYDIHVFNPSGRPLTAAAGTAPALGIATYDAMKLTYTPDADAYGEEIFNFIVSDGISEVQGTAHFTIFPINDAPESSAVGDMTIDENFETGTFRVTLSDPDTQAAYLSLNAYSDNGALIPPGCISITKVSDGVYDLNIKPPYQRFGTALIHLLASDRLLAADRTFTLTVNEINDPPAAYGLTVTTNEEVPVTFAVDSDASDPDNPEVELTVEITENGAHGHAVVGGDGRITYTPIKDFFGTDTVEYRLYDGNSYSETRFAVINVVNVNDAPVISGIDYVQSTPEDTVKQVGFNLYDADDDTVVLSAASSNTAVIPNGNMAFDITEGKGGARMISMSPALNKFGAANITILADDGTETAAYTFQLTVESVNDAPAAAADAVTTNEHIAININVLANDTDIEDAASALRVVELGNPTAPSKGTVSINADGTVRYAPSGHNYGTDTFSYTISDTGGATATATVTVTINPVNDAPTTVNHTRTIAESIPGALTSTGEINVLSGVYDVKGENVTVTGYGTPSKGTIEILGPGLISYTPNMYANGADTFSYTVTDDNASPLTGTGWITINITPVNAPPVLTPLSPLPLEFDEDTTGSLLLRIFDPETPTSSLITTITSTDQSILKDADIRFTGTGTDRTISMTPLPNRYGSLKIRVQSSDGVNTTAGEYDITVRSVNDKPVLGDAAVTINENSSASGRAIAADVETPLLLTYSLKEEAGPSHGTATVNGDGTWEYDPGPYWNGTDSFVIVACDNDPGDPPLTDEGTITVTVRPVNYAPSAADDTASTGEHSAVTVNALGNDTDPDIGDLPAGTEDITIISVTQPANGLVEIAPDGKLLTYTPNPDWDGVDISSHANHWNGTESFEYTIEDVSGLTSSATVTVTVNPVNGPPTAIGEHSSTPEHTGIDIDVLANDIDPDLGDTAPAPPENLTIVSVTQPAHGRVDISPDGKSVHFQPNAEWDGIETMDPNNHYYGLDSFTYTINDKNGIPSTAAVTVDIAPVNDRPNIWGITGPITIDENGTTGALMFSIYDVEGAALTVTRASSNTTLLPLANITLGGSGGSRTVTLTPAAYKNGYSNVTITVRDPGGLTHTLVFRLNVTPVNYAPTANNDSVSTDEHVPVTISVIANDTDPDSGDTPPAPVERIVIDSVTQPSHGAVVMNLVGGYYTTVTYTPSGHYYGPDSFTYTIRDVGGLTSAATVNITVNEVNDIPVAAADTAETDEHVPVTINVLENDTDTKGETLSVSSITQAPLHGSAQIVGNTVLYTPNASGGHYYGTDTFRYEASDGRGGLATALVTVTIIEVNDIPAAADDSAVTDEHVPVTINVLANDSDTKGETLTITGVTQEPLNGTAEIIDGKIVYTPNALGGHWYGTDTFKYTISDGRGGAAEGTVTITVNEVNDIPIAADDSAETDEHEPVTINVLANDSDTKGETLSVSRITQAPLHGSVLIAGGMVFYTPNASGGHYYGTDTFRYEASDGRGGTATALVTVTIIEVNDLPVALPDSAETDEHVPVTVDVLANDSDTKGETLSITGITQEPLHGTAVITGSEVLYTPIDEDGHWYGTDTFKYEAGDGRGGYAEGLVTVTVDPVNDAPEISGIAGPVTTDEDTGTGALSFSVSDIEDDWGSLEVTAFSTNEALTPEGSIMFGGSGGNRTITISPALHENGSADITLTVTDSGELTDTMTFTITVTPVNDAPEANGDNAETAEHEARVINVLANDADPDLFDAPPAPAEDLLVTAVTQPAHGSVSIAGDGKSVTYQPNSDWNGTDLIDAGNHYNGPDSFTYTISDRENVESTATVYVTVTPVNDAVTAFDDAAATGEHEPVVIGVLSNDIDADLVTNPEYEDLTVSSVIQPMHGRVTIAADGKTLTYQPNPDWDGADISDAANHWNGTESFSYTVTDRDGASSSASVYVTVEPVNDAPLAVDDHVNTMEKEGPVTFNVIANDIDVDLGDEGSVEALTIISVTEPLHGTALIKDNKIEYTSTGYYSGEDSFTYTIRDASGEESTAAVYVSITDLNFPPPAPVFTQPYEASFYKSGQSVHVRWNESEDPDGDEVAYTLEFFDGTEWHDVAEGLAGNEYDFIVPEGNTTQAAFRVMATDEPGLSSEKALSARFIIDNLAPAGTVLEMAGGGTAYAAGTWTNKAVTFTLSETTDVIAFATYIRITPEGAAPGEWIRTESVVLNATGKYTVEYYSVDALENATAIDSREVYIDMIAPPVTQIAPVSKQYTNRDITLDLKVGEDVGGSGNAYILLPDGSKADVSPDMTYTVAKNGTYRFTLYDVAGNSSTSSITIKTIDKQAPAMPGVSVSISGASAIISFTLKDDPGGSGNSYFVLPDGSRAAASSGAAWTVSANGEYSFELYDKAGNSTAFTVKVTIIDMTAPDISCDSGAYTIGETSGTAITAILTFTDSESAIKQKGYEVSAGDKASGTYKKYSGDIVISKPGTYYIHAYAVNSFGLKAYRTFGPFIVSASPEGKKGDVTVDTGDIPGGADKIRLPGGEWTDALTLEDIGPGTYTIEVMDKDGNVTSVNITITDEAIAAGSYQTKTPDYVWYILAAVIAALVILFLLLLKPNVAVRVYAADGGGNKKALKTIRRRKRKENEVIVTVKEGQTSGGVYGTITLTRLFTKRMRGHIIKVMLGSAEVYSARVPEDAQGRFEGKIEAWR